MCFLFTYSYTIHLKLFPFLLVTFQVPETKGSIHQSPEEEIETHKETYIEAICSAIDVFVYELAYSF